MPGQRIAQASELELKFSDLYGSTEASIVAVAKDINESIGAQVVRLNASLENSDKTVDEVAARLAAVDGDFGTFKAETTAELAQTNKAWAGKCAELDTAGKDGQRALTDRCNRLENAQATDTATTRAKIDQAVQQNIAACGKVEEKVVAVGDDTDRRLIELTSQIAGQDQDNAAQLSR
eukprot:SAG22_NODE_8247_length_671_cov_0.900350_1_plen_177_part_01